MRDRRFLQDSVTKIEDERCAFQRSENIIHSFIQSLAACDQSNGIEITLHTQARRQSLARPAHRHRRIDADGIDTGFARIKFVAGKRRSSRKSDDLSLRMDTSNFADDFLGGFDDPMREAGRCKSRRPTIEELNDVRASFELLDEMKRNAFAEKLHQFGKAIWIAIGPK